MTRQIVAVALAFGLILTVGVVGVTPASSTVVDEVAQSRTKIDRKQIKKVCIALLNNLSVIRSEGRFLTTAETDALKKMISKAAKKSKDKKLIKAAKMFARSPNGSEIGPLCIKYGFPGDYVTLPTETPTSPPIRDAISSDGTYAIGPDKNPGTYKTDGSPTGCYWQISSDPNGSDILENNVGDGPAYVQVAEGQYLKVTRCGSWTRVG